MPEALEEEEGGGWVRDLEQDVREFCGQGLLHERLVGHPVAFFQRTISTLAGGREARRTVKDSLPQLGQFEVIGQGATSGEELDEMSHGLVPRRLFFAKVSTEGAKKEERAHLWTRGIFQAEDRRSDPCSVFGREDERVTRIAVTDQSR